jgi:hypothetical protein
MAGSDLQIREETVLLGALTPDLRE